MSTEKPNGKTWAQNPVESSDLFGNPRSISQKSPIQLWRPPITSRATEREMYPPRAMNTNPRPTVERARQSTEGNEGNEGGSPLFVCFCSKPPSTINSYEPNVKSERWRRPTMHELANVAARRHSLHCPVRWRHKLTVSSIGVPIGCIHSVTS